MARNFVAASTEYLDIGTSGALANSSTYTLCVTWRSDSNANPTPVYAESASGNNTPLCCILLNNAGSGSVRLLHRGDGGTTVSISHAFVDYTNGAWHRLVAVRKGTTSFQVWVDGGSIGTSTTDPGTTTIDTVAIGALVRPSAAYMEGDIAEVIRWTTAAPDNVALAMSRVQASPLRMYPAASTGYWPIWGLSDPEPDYSGNGYNGTLVNTPTATDHPYSALTFGYDIPNAYVVAVGGANPKGPLGMPFYGPFRGPV